MPDSHFWTDPARMLDVVDAVEPVLADVDGIDQDSLATTVQAYRAQLQALDAEMSEAFASSRWHTAPW